MHEGKQVTIEKLENGYSVISNDRRYGAQHFDALSRLLCNTFGDEPVNGESTKANPYDYLQRSIDNLGKNVEVALQGLSGRIFEIEKDAVRLRELTV